MTKSDIMEIISDMEMFVAEHWAVFKSYMEEKGFTDEDVENMGEKLSEYLKEEGYR